MGSKLTTSGPCEVTGSRYPLFDRGRLKLRHLCERGSDLHFSNVLPLETPRVPFEHPEFGALIDGLSAARESLRPIVLFMGAHPIKLGLSRYLIDLMERGFISHIATNGAGLIHDFELAVSGETSENVARWLRQGQFGLWSESGGLNDLATTAACRGMGLGEAVGEWIDSSGTPHRDLSLAAAAWRLGIPFTSHVSIGSDILHSHPSCDGAAWGAASFTDFLIFARTIEDLEGGVFMNVGSAITGPEVFLKALSMARNVAHQDGRDIRHFTTAVFDLVTLPENWRRGEPSADQPLYYYRPWKTLVVRGVADGGKSFYFCGNHRQTVPNLWNALVCGSATESTPLEQADIADRAMSSAL